MRTFNIRGAQHYCNNFGPAGHLPSLSVRDFAKQRFTQGKNKWILSEGSNDFDDFRLCSLRETHRNVFLTASHFSRSLDLMHAASSHWAHVTLYYGSFFAAKALLGMFGCHLLSEHVIHVAASSPGSQELLVQRIGNRQGMYRLFQRGSHRRFWEVFYNTAGSLVHFLDPAVQPVFTPISGDPMWLTKMRNEVNYDSYASASMWFDFHRTFTAGSFPQCLPRGLLAQYQNCSLMLDAILKLTARFSLVTDAVDGFGGSVTFDDRLRRMIVNATSPGVRPAAHDSELYAL